MARHGQNFRGGPGGAGRGCSRGRDSDVGGRGHGAGRGRGGSRLGSGSGGRGLDGRSEEERASGKGKAKVEGAVKRPAAAALPTPADGMGPNGKANVRGGAPAAAAAADDGRTAKRRKVEADAATGQRCKEGGEKQHVVKAGAAVERLTPDGPSSKQMAAAAATGDGATEAHATVAAAASKPGTQRPANSNWESLKCVVAAAKKPPPPEHVLKRRAKAAAAAAVGEGGAAAATAAPGRRPGMVGVETGLTKVLAMDCEMVGVGPKGSKSVLARVCIVNSSGSVLLDTFVQPKDQVTDYRTWVSGVRPSDLAGAPLYDDVVRQVGEMVKGRILVGHAIGHDLRALLLEDHPRSLLRDTSKYPGLMKELTGGRRVSASLKDLASTHLGLTIQQGEHTPVDDARAALYLYQKFRREWEAAMKSGQLVPAVGGMGSSKRISRGGVRGRDRRSGDKARGGKASATSSAGRHGKDRGISSDGAVGEVHKKKEHRGGLHHGTRGAANKSKGQDKGKRPGKKKGVGMKPLWSLEGDPYVDL